MKCFLLSEEDFELLSTLVDRDPAHGHDGGSSQSITEEERMVYSKVHRFYNYQVRTWIRQMQDRKERG